MDLLFWLIISFILIGLIVIISLKKDMERKLILIKENMGHKEISIKPIVWWIVGVISWGIISIISVVLWFSVGM